jgi:hypothetical protein
MKKTSHVLFSFIFAALLTLSACGGGENFDYVSTSPSGDATVTLKGTKNNFADPYMVNINIKGYGQNETVGREIYAGNLSTENVSVVWSDDHNCIITFLQQDDTKVKMAVTVGEEGLQLQEIK